MSVVKTDEFVKEIALELETTQKDARMVYDAVFAAAQRIMVEQQAGVPLGKLGNLKVELKPAREHHNIQDPKGAKISKPAYFATKYSVSKPLKEALKAVAVK